MSLRDLYQEIIVDHGKQPRNFGELPDATLQKDGHNPLCGDQLTIFLIEKGGVVEDVRFKGTGCAISVASASLMTECIKGKRLEEVKRMFDCFHQLVTEGQSSDDDLGKLAVFAGVAEFPVRVKCATLAWHTVKAALDHDAKPVSTE